MANNDIRVTLPEQSNLSATVYDINYIPDYIKAEQERRANETIRIANEQGRIALAEDLEYKRDTDYWRGDKGDTGATPDISATATIDANIGTPSVTVTRTGTDEEPNLTFAFSNLKGEKGDTGSYTAGDNIDITNGTIKTITRGLEYIVSSNASATHNWTGTTTDTMCKNGQLYEGKAILYYVSKPGAVGYNKYLKLTLPDGTQTSDIEIKGRGNENIGTIFIAQNVPTCIMLLTYDGTYWRINAYPIMNMKLSTTSLGYSTTINTEGTYNSSTNKLVTKSYVDDIVGDIDSVLDAINGEIL